MLPQPPSFSPVSPSPHACTERLALMVKAAGELAIEIGLGASAVVDRMVVELLGEVRAAVPDLARERASGRATTRTMLDSLADKLEAAADHRGTWPRHQDDRPPLPNETQLRALIARMRMLTRN